MDEIEISTEDFLLLDDMITFWFNHLPEKTKNKIIEDSVNDMIKVIVHTIFKYRGNEHGQND